MVFDIRGIPLSVDSIWETGEAGIPLGKSRVYTRVSQSIDAPTKILVHFGLKIYIIFFDYWERFGLLHLKVYCITERGFVIFFIYLQGFIKLC